MNILITGINGFVAGHLAERLARNPAYRLWGIARSAQLALPLLQRSSAEGHGKALHNLTALLQYSDTPKAETHR